jgi:hypothetical protein
MTAGAIIDFSKKELRTNVETTFNMLTTHFCKNNTVFIGMLEIVRTSVYFHTSTINENLSSLYSLLHMKSEGSSLMGPQQTQTETCPAYLTFNISHTENKIFISEHTIMNVGLLVGIWDSEWNCCYCNWEVHLKVITRLFKLQINLKNKIIN